MCTLSGKKKSVTEIKLNQIHIYIYICIYLQVCVEMLDDEEEEETLRFFIKLSSNRETKINGLSERD